MNKTKFIVIIASIIIIVVGGGLILSSKNNNQSGQLDQFAQCLTNNGAKFYGTFWCSHCQNQKKMFGQSAKYLPYIECSSPDGQEQLQICKDAGITGYPTWIFADGSKLSGEVSLTTLAEKTQCILPQ